MPFVFQHLGVWLQSSLAECYSCSASCWLPCLIKISLSVSKHSIVWGIFLSLFTTLWTSMQPFDVISDHRSGWLISAQDEKNGSYWCLFRPTGTSSSFPHLTQNVETTWRASSSHIHVHKAQIFPLSAQTYVNHQTNITVVCSQMSAIYLDEELPWGESAFPCKLQ